MFQHICSMWIYLNIRQHVFYVAALWTTCWTCPLSQFWPLIWQANIVLHDIVIFLLYIYTLWRYFGVWLNQEPIVHIIIISCMLLKNCTCLQYLHLIMKKCPCTLTVTQCPETKWWMITCNRAVTLGSSNPESAKHYELALLAWLCESGLFDFSSEWQLT